MAQVQNLRIGVAPRKPSDDVHLTVTGSFRLFTADVRALGGRPVRAEYVIKDGDWPGGDDTVGPGSSFFELESYDVGHNSFTIEVFLSHDEVLNSEPKWESGAELYARVRGRDPKTDWQTSQELTVEYQ